MEILSKSEKREMHKTVGIIGGMGPFSTIELMRKIMQYTPAKQDQDHLHLVVDSRAQIPDRTAAILGQGPSPVPLLQKSARTLEQAGADFLAIACNTAHHFYDHIAAAVSIPVLHMHDILKQELAKQFPPGSSLALLATTGTLNSGIFQKHLTEYELLLPDETTQQEWVMKAVYGPEGIKSVGVTAENSFLLRRAAEGIAQRTLLQACIAGCTEIEHALAQMDFFLPVIQPLDLLAREIVRRARR